MDQTKTKSKILIADDSEMNRAILTDMLEEEYDIVEAENGAQAVEIIRSLGSEIALLLLDIVMPELDGFGVLAAMNKNHWIEDVPVIVISSESGAEQIERAYDLGVTDFISRPFDALIVHKRVVNTILLHAQQQRLVELVATQMYESQQQKELMIDILAHVVEFRNGESGLHVRHVQSLTALLLEHLRRTKGPFQRTPAEISIISTASALHDIGKISIPAKILNKPGRLTDEEFALMKTHTTVGAEMLANLPAYQNEPLVKVSYEICRWHHERWDGRGYPDGLKGDEIPISAQVVALVDVYDALTSKRVYKDAFPHKKAVEMILNGECGAFNPVLLDCFRECSDDIQQQMSTDEELQIISQRNILSLTAEILQRRDVTVSKRTLQLLEHERVKHDFFAALTDDIQFEFTMSPCQVTLSTYGAQKLGFPEVVKDPLLDDKVLALCGPDMAYSLSDLLRSTSPGEPNVSVDCLLHIGGEDRWHRIVARAIWSADEPPRYTGAIGKAMDIHDSREQLKTLERLASTDPLTGLLNHASAKKRIESRLKERPLKMFALIIMDLDLFKSANDTYGHLFGDQLLEHLAGNLRKCVRGGDIVARIGGDEFLIFMEYKGELEPIVRRIHGGLCDRFQDFEISLSMGVARTDMVGEDYGDLFRAADAALYTIKHGQRGRGAKYVFYDPSMTPAAESVFSISPIDHDGQTGHPKGGTDK